MGELRDLWSFNNSATSSQTAQHKTRRLFFRGAVEGKEKRRGQEAASLNGRDGEGERREVKPASQPQREKKKLAALCLKAADAFPLVH